MFMKNWKNDEKSRIYTALKRAMMIAMIITTMTPANITIVEVIATSTMMTALIQWMMLLLLLMTTVTKDKDDEDGEDSDDIDDNDNDNSFNFGYGIRDEDDNDEQWGR